MVNQPYDIWDISVAAAGQQKIDWVSNWMRVLNGLYDQYKTDGVFANKTIGICIHLEAKTAYLATIMKKLGAEVWITGSNTLSTKDDVCAALATNGIHVFAKYGASEFEYHSYIKTLAMAKPHAIVDDGGDMCEYLHEHPEYGVNLKGICEETTTGVARLKERAGRGKLFYPAVAINDARSKFLFDNRYGTGQSSWTAIMHLTNINIAGKTVVVIGYGWVGKGISLRAVGLGAEVVVCEIDPWKALEARMEGFRVMSIAQAVISGDFFITTTGVANVLRVEHIKNMKAGAFLANAGHFDYEIDVPGLRKMAKSHQVVREEIQEFILPDGKPVYLLAQGGIINIAGGFGHPVEIMDLSFSLQLASMHYILTTKNLEKKVYSVPDEIDEVVVREKLRVEGIDIDS